MSSPFANPALLWTILILICGVVSLLSIISFTSAQWENGTDFMFGDEDGETKSISEMIVASKDKVRARGTLGTGRGGGGGGGGAGEERSEGGKGCSLFTRRYNGGIVQVCFHVLLLPSPFSLTPLSSRYDDNNPNNPPPLHLQHPPPPPPPPLPPSCPANRPLPLLRGVDIFLPGSNSNNIQTRPTPPLPLRRPILRLRSPLYIPKDLPRLHHPPSRNRTLQVKVWSEHPILTADVILPPRFALYDLHVLIDKAVRPSSARFMG